MLTHQRWADATCQRHPSTQLARERLRGAAAEEWAVLRRPTGAGLNFTRDLRRFAPPIRASLPVGVIAKQGSVYLFTRHQKTQSAAREFEAATGLQLPLALARRVSEGPAMYLKEVASRPPEGMTRIAFKKLRDDGEAIPEILHLFRFKRRNTDHLVRFTEEVMRGPSPLSPGLRELIGAYISRKHQCSFCSDAHAAAACEFMEKELVDEVLLDLENSRLDAAHKALFRYIGKLAENPARVTDSDIHQLKQAGWCEEAIYDALTVASIFKFYNTWNGGSGVQNMSSADYAYSGKVLRTLGYCMDFKLQRLLRMAANKLIGAARAVLLMDRNKGSGHSRQWSEQRPRRIPSV